MLSDRRLSCLSVLSACNVGVLWPNGWMDQDATWYGVGLGPGYTVLDDDDDDDDDDDEWICKARHRWGPSSPTSKKRGGAQQPHISWPMYCGQTAGWIKILLGV